MRQAMGNPHVHVSLALGDCRYAEQLERHLATASIQGEWVVSSVRSIPAGERAPARVRDLLVHANVVALLATARFFNDPLARAEMELSLKRYRAGEIHLVVIHAADCLLDPQLAGVPTIAPESFVARSREQFWRTCASRIALLCETAPPGRPRYEDEDNRCAGEALRLAWWAGSWSSHSPFSQLGTHQAKLRRGGLLRPGDILACRFHVRRRTSVTAGERWEGFDLVDQRPVDILVLEHEVSAKLADRTDALRPYVEIRHPAVIRVIMTPRKEPGLSGRYVVLERFDGAPLHAAVLDGRIALDHGVDGLAPVAEALAEMHDLGLSHGNVSMDTIRVGTENGGVTCKLALVFPLGAREMERDDDGKKPTSPVGDTTSFARVVLSCLHGAILPSGASAAQLRHILHMSEARAELKAVLARNLVEETARPADLKALARLLRKVPGPASLRGTAWLDLEMRQVAGGLVWLGARADDQRARPIERPARQVIVHGFSLCVYPVTQRLYTTIMGTNPSACVDACAPVHRVTFLEALQFCNLLSAQCGLQPAYVINRARVSWRTDSDGYRLPTEAEWEHAAKGDNSSLYPWGDDEPGDRVCWNGAGNALGWHNRKGPSPVWDHPESVTPTGLFDMVGNVWEWCWDWFAPYADWLVEEEGPLLEPIGPSLSRIPPVPCRVEGGAYRVLRGGAWNLEDAAWLRTTARSMDLETVRDPDIGFRVARGAKPLARELPLRPEAAESVAVWVEEMLA